VRIVHIPTGLTATAGEFRSQQRNKTNALHRLRHRLAIDLREPVREPFAVPQALASFFVGGKLCCSVRDESYPAVLGLILDVIELHRGAVSDSSSQLGLTTGNLVGFLQRDGDALAAVNRFRKLAGVKSLGG
jgi:hypothetical protein